MRGRPVHCPTVLDWYARWAASDSSAAALVLGSSTLTYGGLWDRVTAIAARLRAAGMEPGSRVVLMISPREPDWLAGMLGVVEAGGQAIIPEAVWDRSEVETLTQHVGVWGWLLSAEDLQRTGHEKGACKPFYRDQFATYDPGIWLFTSGTTASPKLRFRSTVFMQEAVQRMLPRLPPAIAGGRPRSLNVIHPYHGLGLFNSLLLQHALGGTVYSADPERPAEAAGLIEDQGIQVMYAWPAHLDRLARRDVWPRPGESPLVWCVSSSNVLAPEAAERFTDASGCPVRQQYGTTETGPLTLDSSEQPDVRSVGTALDGIEIRVTAGLGEPCAPGEEGRVGSRFLNGLTPTAETEADGFFYPGDLGRKEADGRVFLTRRYRPFTDERATPEESP